MNNFEIGEYIIYVNGDRYELGRIKTLTETGAFIAYHGGETGAKTSYDLIHKLTNAYCINSTILGGKYFDNIDIKDDGKCASCANSIKVLNNSCVEKLKCKITEKYNKYNHRCDCDDYMYKGDV